MRTSYELGRKGEAEAAAILAQKNYRILEKNYRYRKAEVDLIVQKKNTLVAVEIKPLFAGKTASPLEQYSPY